MAGSGLYFIANQIINTITGLGSDLITILDALVLGRSELSFILAARYSHHPRELADLAHRYVHPWWQIWLLAERHENAPSDRI